MTFDLYLQLSKGREEASSIGFNGSILFADTKLKCKPVQLGEERGERRGERGERRGERGEGREERGCVWWERGGDDQVVTCDMFNVTTHCGQLLHIVIRGTQRCKTNFLKQKISALKCPTIKVVGVHYSGVPYVM